MKSPISVCLITRRDPHLIKCLESFAPFVEEICIVCNDMTDKDSQQVAEQFGAKFEYFIDCNDADGRINDFSMARNKSLELATQPWIMWIDSDDLLTGAEHLQSLLAKAQDDCCLLFSYEYAYNAQGQVSCRHYRERVAPRGKTHFINPVHEVMVAKEGVSLRYVRLDDVVVKHQRQYNVKATEPQRNLRILKDYVEKTEGKDPRQLYYLGLEYSNTGDNANAIKYLTDYVTKSGWMDERAMACYRLVDIYQGQGQFDQGLTWAFKSLELVDWFESYYAICKMFYFQQNWKRCAHYGNLAVACPPTETLLFVNDADRFDIHVYLNVALNHLGDVVGALESVQAGLVGNPNHPNLLHNFKIYQKHLNLQTPVEVKETDLDKLEIVFATGQGLENWDPETVARTGIGGSELMLMQNAKNLAALGHTVKVFASPANPGVYDGVDYQPISQFGNLACDVLIVSRYAQLLGDNFNVKAKLKLLWVHDVCAVGATNELLLKADRVLALSQWHKDNMIKVHKLHPDHIVVTRNGIDLERFRATMETPARNKYRCINSSSPDRSWAVLLDMWPEIKKQVPEAELALCYGFDNWKKVAAHDPLQLDLIKKLEQQIADLAPLGVTYYGRVSQDKLTELFLTSGVWTHPTWFTETSCITAMEAQAAGLHIVTSNLAALKETVKAGVKLDGDWTSKEYQDQFIAETVKALQSNERYFPLIGDFEIKRLAVEWYQLFAQLLEVKKTHPLVPYQPTAAYTRRKKRSHLVKLNICAGTNVFPHDGWINIDKYDFSEYFNYVKNPNVPLDGMPAHQQELATFLREGGDFKFLQHDIVEPFNQFHDNSVDCIYVGQAIEHLSIHQAPKFLGECLRMLKPGGVLRMTTPDLSKLLQAYNNNEMMKFAADQPAFYQDLDPSAQLCMLMFGAAGENCTQEHYEGHFMNYTERSMTDVLEKVGFREIEFRNWTGYSKCQELADEVVDFGLSHSFVVEGVK